MGKKQLTLDGAAAQKTEGKGAFGNYARFGYDRYEVISAWIKEMRLGNTKRALYWLRIMMQSGETLYYIARRLYMFAFEDAYTPEAAIYAHSLFEAQKMFGELDHNPVLRGTVYMCKAPKFWEDKIGAEEDVLWYQIKDDVDAVLKGDTSKKLPIPSYAIDQHTLRGKRMLQRGEKIDDRYSGTFEGRMSMIWEYNAYRKLLGGDQNRKRKENGGQRGSEAGATEAQGENKGASQATEGERRKEKGDL